MIGKGRDVEIYSHKAEVNPIKIGLSRDENDMIYHIADNVDDVITIEFLLIS